MAAAVGQMASQRCRAIIGSSIPFPRLCLSKISKCLSAWELVFLHNSRRCSFFSRHSSHLWPRSSGRCFPRAREPGFTPSNRRAPQVCRKAPKIDRGRPPAVDLSVAPLARLALGVGHRQARTVVAWHRAAFRLFWTCKVRCEKPGRRVISSEVRDLIRKMCRENPAWGAPRIHGELLKLGIDIGEEPLCTCTGISQEFLLDMPKVYRVYIHTTLECSSPLIRPMRARSISKLLTGLRS